MTRAGAPRFDSAGGPAMTRKNLKIDESTYERLREEKGQFETWDGCLNRLLDERQEGKKPGDVR